jgi:hypothetical protein
MHIWRNLPDMVRGRQVFLVVAVDQVALKALEFFVVFN